jgi:guanidinoacetate N-methyltransferase
MTRKLKRTSDFELRLEIRDDGFLRPPADAQRHALLNQFMKEAALDLAALDDVAARFVPGGERHRPVDMRERSLTDEQIMEDWQLPLMRAMADIVGSHGGDVLEIGFGRGVSATFLQEHDLRSHTIIECNDSVIERFHRWREDRPGRDIRMVRGLWQDTIDALGEFDGIFFHTYALDQDEAIDLLARSVTFADHFFPAAAAHLRPGGVFTYLTNEMDSLSRAHQRMLLERFSSVRLQVVPLDLPTDVRDAWWADSMVVAEVVK